MNEFANSEVVFGSACRGEIDRLSDRDILIVDTDTSLLRRRQKSLEAEGWSVASYTFNKLQHLVAKQSLFIQHLKQESRIIHDRDDRFQSCIQKFSPKKSYSNEISENATLAWLANTYPQGQRGSLWALDVLYVTFRNFGVLTLAECGRYVFSYRAILNELCDLGIIRSDDIPLLTRLRDSKSIYRNPDNILIDFCADQTLRAALNALPHPVFPNNPQCKSASEFINSYSFRNGSRSSYFKLRSLERIYIAIEHTCPETANCIEMRQLKRWIENPRAYAAFAASNEAKVLPSLEQKILSYHDRATSQLCSKIADGYGASPKRTTVHG